MARYCNRAPASRNDAPARSAHRIAPRRARRRKANPETSNTIAATTLTASSTGWPTAPSDADLLQACAPARARGFLEQLGDDDRRGTGQRCDSDQAAVGIPDQLARCERRGGECDRDDQLAGESGAAARFGLRPTDKSGRGAVNKISERHGDEGAQEQQIGQPATPLEIRHEQARGADRRDRDYRLDRGAATRIGRMDRPRKLEAEDSRRQNPGRNCQACKPSWPQADSNEPDRRGRYPEYSSFHPSTAPSPGRAPSKHHNRFADSSHPARAHHVQFLAPLRLRSRHFAPTKI